MKVVENGLIPVYENENKEQLVNARELHEFLEIGKDFSTWIKDRIVKYGFVEDEDYSTILGKTSKLGGRPTTDYVLTLDSAKEIAMVENNQKGKEVRRYFINIEKRLKEKQFESLDHFQKEQCQLGFVMDKLNLSETGKIKLLTDFNKVHNLSTEYLPVYVDEKVTKPLTELLKQFNVNMSAVKFNKLLLEKGIIAESERKSSKGLMKKFKTIVNTEYGKNLINPKNPKEVQPHYYEDKFSELLKIVM